jgi:hypothetical protein
VGEGDVLVINYLLNRFVFQEQNRRPVFVAALFSVAENIELTHMFAVPCLVTLQMPVNG